MASFGNAYGQGLTAAASSPAIQKAGPPWDNGMQRLTSTPSLAISSSGSASLPVGASSPGIPFGRPDVSQQDRPRTVVRDESHPVSHRKTANYVDVRSGISMQATSPPPQPRSRSPLAENVDSMPRGLVNPASDSGSSLTFPSSVASPSLSLTGPAGMKSNRSNLRSPPAQLKRDEGRQGSMNVPNFSSSSRRPVYAHADRQGSAQASALPSSRVSRMGGGLRPVLGGSHSLPKGTSRGTAASSEATQSNMGDDVASNDNAPEGPRFDASRASSGGPNDMSARRGGSLGRDPSNRYMLTASSTPSLAPELMRDGALVGSTDEVALEQTVVPALGQFPGPGSVRRSESEDREDALRKQVKFTAPNSQDPVTMRRLSSGRKQSPSGKSDQSSLSLPGLLSLPEEGPEGSPTSTADAAMVAGLSVDQYLDMRIAKIRGIVDWRINDVSRVIQHAEDAMTQQLENERRARQDSVAAVRQLAETQKLIIEASVEQQRSRIDNVMETIESCFTEVKTLSAITGKNCDDIMLMQTGHNERAQAQQGVVGAQQMELLEKRLQCEIDVHKAAMSQTVAKERQRIDALYGDVERRRGLTEVSNSTSLSTASQDSILRLGSVQADHSGRLESIEQTLRSVQVQADAMHRLQQNLSKLEVAAKFDHECLETLRQKCEKSSLHEGRSLTPQETSSLGIADDRITGLATSVDKHNEMIEEVKRDMKLWESLLTDYVVQAKERADSICLDVEKLKTLQPPSSLPEAQRSLGHSHSPSSEALEATLEGRVLQLATRLDCEQGDRRDAIRRLQSSLNDLQTMQHNNAQEMGTFRSQLQLLPDRCKEISSRLDDEVCAREDALSFVKQEMRGLELLVKSAPPRDSSRPDALAERVNSIDTRLKQEERQREDAFDALRRDLERIPSVIYDAISEEKGRIDKLDDLLRKVASKGEAVDALTGQLDVLKQQQNLLLEPALAAGPQVRQIGERYDKIQESIQKLETEHQIREDAFALIEKTMGQSEAALRESVVQERRRIDTLAPEVQALRVDLQGLRGALERISPGSSPPEQPMNYQSLVNSVAKEREQIDARLREIGGM